MICNKCNEEKPIEQYETYWHSNRKKHYTRRICKACIRKQQKENKFKLKQDKEILIQEPTSTEIVQPVVLESIVEDFSTNPDYKFCVGCNTWKPKTEYFVAKNKNRNTVTIFKRCKWCHNSNNREKAKLYWEERRKNYGGSENVSAKPGTYIDEYQKEQTFWLMKLMGWTYVEEKNVWIKQGIKELQEDRIFWPNVKETKKVVKFNPQKKVLPKDERKDVDIEKLLFLKKCKWTMEQISDEMKCSIPTLRSRLKKYG
jgi:hypothetical protein